VRAQLLEGIQGAPDAGDGDPQLRVGQIVLVDVIVGQPPRAVEGF
jgi:hypothetical protein